MEYSKKSLKIQMDLMKKEKPNKDLINLLEEAKNEKILMAVATSSLRYRAIEILNMLKLNIYFPIIIAAEDVKNHKPNLDLFLEAAKQMGVKPEECVVIEDAENGVQAAKTGNIKAVALLTDYHSREELKDADLIIKDFSELSIEKLKTLINTK